MKIDNKFPHKGEVFLYWIGNKETVGTEIKKIRPAVIVSTDELNKYKYRFVVIPITKRRKEFLEFEVPVQVCGREGLAMTDQIKTVDHSRLIKKLDKLTESEMSNIKEKMNFLFDLI